MTAIAKRAAILAVTCAIASIWGTGCNAVDNIVDKNKPTTEQETAEAAQKLINRASLEDAERQVHTVVEQIGAAASELVPGMQFEWIDDRIRSDCDKPFDRTSGQIVYLRKLWAQKPIPENVWPSFLDRARQLAGAVGASQAQTVRNESTQAPTGTPGATTGRHDVSFYNPDDGTTIRIGSNRATTVAATVGCHLL